MKNAVLALWFIGIPRARQAKTRAPLFKAASRIAFALTIKVLKSSSPSLSLLLVVVHMLLSGGLLDLVDPRAVIGNAFDCGKLCCGICCCGCWSPPGSVLPPAAPLRSAKRSCAWGCCCCCCWFSAPRFIEGRTAANEFINCCCGCCCILNVDKAVSLFPPRMAAARVEIMALASKLLVTTCPWERFPDIAVWFIPLEKEGWFIEEGG
mmetsp:Transcript_26352/g.46475  ORF Transcript_26352/g.46475 Transcript_26352/m.46475 type:complete len:208 (-) Transcript_26352:632-1255(-)